jgi:N-methylhydantoinase B/oxoprolinase/acetone carboxylase alpha subunit
MYYTPTQIIHMLEDMKDQFPEEIPTKGTIAGYKVKYAEDIRQRRAEISEKDLPILDPAWRLLRYQEAVEEALEGTETPSKFGTFLKKDFKAAISALAQVDKITGYGKQDDEQESVKKMMRQIIDELRNDLLATGKYSPDEVEQEVQRYEEKFSSELVM